VVSLLLSAFTAVAVWVLLNQQGVVLQIGPLTVRGAPAENFGHVMAGIAALIVGAMTVCAWRSCWRAGRRCA
jgi:hypothetical protein